MRTVRPLNDKQIRAKIKEAKDKPVTLWDGGGLYLLIKPNGSALWRFQFTLAGKKKPMALTAQNSSYPAISLQAARDKAHELRGIVADGIDPVAQRREEAEQQKVEARTFQAVTDEWYSTVEGRYRPTNKKKVLWLLRILGESLGQMPLIAIRYSHILATLRMAADKGNVETAHRLGSKAKEILSYARRCGYIDTNPADDYHKDLPPVKSKHYAHVVDEKKLGALLRAIDDYQEGTIQVRYALRILPYLALRVSELRGARWEEIDFDKALWTIPAERQDRDGTGMKMRIPHTVPLPTQVVALFRDLRTFTGDGPICFPSPVSKKGDRPISDMTLRNALLRMGYGKDEITPHGFRHTFSTLANDLGLGDGDHIEAALAHKDTDKIRGTYNHASYLEQRGALAQRWADYLDELRTRAD